MYSSNVDRSSNASHLVPCRQCALLDFALCCGHHRPGISATKCRSIWRSYQAGASMFTVDVVEFAVYCLSYFVFVIDLHCALRHVATSSCRGHVDDATEPFLLLHRELPTEVQATDRAETAAIDGLVSSWSENISVSLCLWALGYGLTLWCAFGLLVGGRNTSASVTVTVIFCRLSWSGFSVGYCIFTPYNL